MPGFGYLSVVAQRLAGQAKVLSAVSASAAYKAEMDSSDNLLKATVNGGAWTPFVFAAGGVVSMQNAYDGGGAVGSGAGRSVTTMSGGAVVFTNDQANTTDVLQLNKTPAAAQAGNCLTATVGANATGAGVAVAFAGTQAAGQTNAAFLVQSTATQKRITSYLIRNTRAGVGGVHYTEWDAATILTADGLDVYVTDAQSGGNVDALTNNPAVRGHVYRIPTTTNTGTRGVRVESTQRAGACFEANLTPTANGVSGPDGFLATMATTATNAAYGLRYTRTITPTGGTSFSGGALIITNTPVDAAVTESGVLVSITHTTGPSVTDGTTGMTITMTPGVAGSDTDAIVVTQGPNSIGSGLTVTHNGTATVTANQFAMNGNAARASTTLLLTDITQFTSAVTGTTRFLYITNPITLGAAVTVVQNQNLVQIDNTPNATGGTAITKSGRLLYLNHAPVGAGTDTTTGLAIDMTPSVSSAVVGQTVTMAANATGQALTISHAGAVSASTFTVSNTTTSSLAGTIFLVDQTRTGSLTVSDSPLLHRIRYATTLGGAGAVTHSSRLLRVQNAATYVTDANVEASVLLEVNHAPTISSGTLTDTATGIQVVMTPGSSAAVVGQQIRLDPNASASARHLYLDSHNAGTAGAVVEARYSHGTAALPTAVLSGDVLLNISASGMDAASGSYRVGASLRFAADGANWAASDTPGRIMFFTTADGGVTETERLRVDAAGDITAGAGAVPSAFASSRVYSVVDQSNTSVTTTHLGVGFLAHNTNTTNNNFTGIWFAATNTVGGLFTTGSVLAQVTNHTAATAATRLLFATVDATISGGAPTTKMAITSAGVVCVNALQSYNSAAGETFLHEINSTATSPEYAANSWSVNAGNGGAISLARSGNATIGTHGAVANNTTLGYIFFRGSDGTAFRNSSYISGEVDGVVGASDVPGRILVWTAPDGTITPVERVRFNAAGGISIGPTAAAAATQGMIQWGTGFGAAFTVTAPQLFGGSGDDFFLVAGLRTTAGVGRGTTISAGNGVTANNGGTLTLSAGLGSAAGQQGGAIVFQSAISGAGATRVTLVTLNASGSLQWNSGLTSINQLVGPTDETFRVVAGTPAAGAGLDVRIDGSVAVAGAGGSVRRVAGNGAGGVFAGGSCLDTSGNGVNGVGLSGGAAGGWTYTPGIPGTTDTGTGGAGGTFTISARAGGLASGAAGIGGPGSGVSINCGAGGATTDAAGGNGGAGGDCAIVLGAGGNATNAGATDGRGGIFSVTFPAVVGNGAQAIFRVVLSDASTIINATNANALTLGATGGTLGFLGAAASARQTGGENITNNVTAGGVSGTVDDFANTVGATDAVGAETVSKADIPKLSDVNARLASIRTDIYQLARALKQDHDALRLFGLLT